MTSSEAADGFERHSAPFRRGAIERRYTYPFLLQLVAAYTSQAPAAGG